MIIPTFKPSHKTSFNMVSAIRKSMHTKKVGHAGTLDPLADGVLTILTDQDTKRQAEFMQMDKEYKAQILFGAVSPTYDLEGPITISDIPSDLDNLTKQINEVLTKFIGIIDQRVPAFSAVKVGGKALYKKARKDDVDIATLPVKQVHIYDIKFNSLVLKSFAEVCENVGLDVSLQKFSFPSDTKFPIAEFVITCGKGTYIRSFASDLGEMLGCGALLSRLTRTRVGDYRVEDCKSV